MAYRDGEPAGWTRLTPRTDLDWLLDRFAKYDFGPDDAWSLWCFFVARRARRQGVMTTLNNHATSFGHDHDTVIEAYPIDTTVHRATRNTFPGILQTFLNAGFTEQGRLARAAPSSSVAKVRLSDIRLVSAERSPRRRRRVTS